MEDEAEMTRRNEDAKLTGLIRLRSFTCRCVAQTKDSDLRRLEDTRFGVWEEQKVKTAEETGAGLSYGGTR